MFDVLAQWRKFPQLLSQVRPGEIYGQSDCSEHLLQRIILSLRFVLKKILSVVMRVYRKTVDFL